MYDRTLHQNPVGEAVVLQEPRAELGFIELSAQLIFPILLQRRSELNDAF
jgi:hypothetical protein